MGEMKHGIYTASAGLQDGVICFQLMDHLGRIVADGIGDTVSEAQEDAFETTVHDGARLCLRDARFPESLAD
jgi:hypothetical protein